MKKTISSLALTQTVKHKAFNAANNSKHQQQLAKFEENDLNSEKIKSTEKLLIGFIGNKESISISIATFDRLKHFVFHCKDKEFHIETLSCTSETIRLHIKRAFLQTRKWINSAIIGNNAPFSLNYGYKFEEGKRLVVPQIVYQQKVPLDFLQPYTCLKCPRANVCLHRMKDITCCDFCKYRGG